MSLVLCFGYAIIQITGMHHGYWILLTSLFVCQPNYNATAPPPEVKDYWYAGRYRHWHSCAVVCTVTGRAAGATGYYRRALFAFRNVQYARMQRCSSLLVLLCFNLLGEGFEVALPRVIDTALIG